MEVCVDKKRQISFECKTHQSFEPQLFYLPEKSQGENEDILFCTKCFNQKKLNLHVDNLLSMDDFVSSNEKTIIPKWPPLLNQDILFEINQFIQDNSKFASSQKELVTSYFDSFKQEIHKLIEEREKEMLIKCDKLPLLEEQLLKAYNLIADKEKMKQIFTAPNTDYEQASAKLKEIIKLKEDSKKQNQDSLEQAYNPFIQNLEQFDQNTPNQIKKGIIEMIQSINFFPDLIDEQDNNNNNNNQKKFSNTKLRSELMKMIENKTNHCTQPFLEEIQSKLEQFSCIFDNFKAVDIYENEFTQPIEFKDVGKVELQKLDELCQNLAKKQEDIEVSPQIKLLLELINSPSNYLTKEFQDRLITIMKQLTPFFNDIDLRNCIQENKAPINFRKLEFEQVELIEKLVDKMIEKGYQNDENNKIEDILPNTNIIISFLQDRFINNEKLSVLLQQYPIFEFIQIKEFTFKKSTNNSSETYLDMKKTDNQNTKFVTLNPNSWYSILSDQYLNKNITYKIIFEYIPKNISNFHFTVGLTSQGNNDYCYSDKLSTYIYQGGFSGYGVEKVKQGVHADLKNFRHFELLVNLSKGILEFADLPSHNNIVEINDDKKQRLAQDTQYQIGFSLYNSSGAGDELTIQNIQIIQD